MGYLEKNLFSGEEVLLEAKLHPALWLLPIAQTVLMLIVIAIAFGGALGLGSTDAAALGIVGLAVAVVAAGNGLVWVLLIPNHIMAYLGLKMVVTNQRIIRKYGLFRTGLQELPLDKIETLTASQKGFWGKIFGYGDIDVQGIGGTHFGITHVSRPMDFRRKAMAILENRDKD
jgi:uncharacterized membrane protein YdbT with pleckstrin-like domain